LNDTQKDNDNSEFITDDEIVEKIDPRQPDNIFVMLQRLAHFQNSEDADDSDCDDVQFDAPRQQKQKKRRTPEIEEIIESEDVCDVENAPNDKEYNNNNTATTNNNKNNNNSNTTTSITTSTTTNNNNNNNNNNMLQLMKSMGKDVEKFMQHPGIKIEQNIPNIEDLPSDESVDFEFYIEVDVDSDGNIIEAGLEQSDDTMEESSTTVKHGYRIQDQTVYDFEIPSSTNEDVELEIDIEIDEDNNRVAVTPICIFNDTTSQSPMQFVSEEENIEVKDTIPDHLVIDMREQQQHRYNAFDAHFRKPSQDLNNGRADKVVEEPVLECMRHPVELYSNPAEHSQFPKDEVPEREKEAPRRHGLAEQEAVVEMIPEHEVIDVKEKVRQQSVDLTMLLQNMKEDEEEEDKEEEKKKEKKEEEEEEGQVMKEVKKEGRRGRNLPIHISFGFGHDIYLHARCSN